MVNKRMYIDFKKIQELLISMTKIELINFLNRRIIIPIDDSSYNFLITLNNEKDLNIKKVNNL